MLYWSLLQCSPQSEKQIALERLYNLYYLGFTLERTAVIVLSYFSSTALSTKRLNPIHDALSIGCPSIPRECESATRQSQLTSHFVIMNVLIESLCDTSSAMTRADLVGTTSKDTETFVSKITATNCCSWALRKHQRESPIRLHCFRSSRTICTRRRLLLHLCQPR